MQYLRTIDIILIIFITFFQDYQHYKKEDKNYIVQYHIYYL